MDSIIGAYSKDFRRLVFAMYHKQRIVAMGVDSMLQYGLSTDECAFGIAYHALKALEEKEKQFLEHLNTCTRPLIVSVPKQP